MKTNENLITVTGKGSLHVVPDVTRIILKLISLHDSYEEAYELAKSNTDCLTKIMKELKLKTDLPKTTSLDIDKKAVTEYDNEGYYKGEKFLGFELDHRVKIDIGIDNTLLHKLVQRIGKHLRQAEINIGYTLRDPRPSQLKMLERAVKDAREKAQIMAQACGCTLGLVKDINYTVQEIHVYSQAREIHAAEEALCCNAESLDITPEDLALSDQVTVMWHLSNSTNKPNDETIGVSNHS